MRYYIHYTTGKATHHYPYTWQAFAVLTGLTTAAIREALKQHGYVEGTANGCEYVLSPIPTHGKHA